LQCYGHLQNQVFRFVDGAHTAIPDEAGNAVLTADYCVSLDDHRARSSSLSRHSECLWGAQCASSVPRLPGNVCGPNKSVFVAGQHEHKVAQSVQEHEQIWAASHQTSQD